VPSGRVATSGRGESEPIAPNDTDANRQKNRRVEVAITAGDQMKSQAKAQAGTSN
jgi:flagellar motor protein MotB